MLGVGYHQALSCSGSRDRVKLRVKGQGQGAGSSAGSSAERRVNCVVQHNGCTGPITYHGGGEVVEDHVDAVLVLHGVALQVAFERQTLKPVFST
jgi:hypothetical protein